MGNPLETGADFVVLGMNAQQEAAYSDREDSTKSPKRQSSLVEMILVGR